ncbi:MAG: ABC-ATPase domain-containing protein [Halobacteriota archaeon]|nr:ABC-ATPase domain-containing protein [Halobacteriota archaeon]
MPSESDLRRVLQRIDSRGYKAYNDIKGRYDFECFTLFVDYVQRDPFAPPSQMRVRIGQDLAGFDVSLFNTNSREVALRDFLTRRFSDAAYRICKANRGTGNSGVISIDRPGQEVLRRTSAFVTKEYIEVRFVMGLPAYGRKVASKHAEEMLLFELPEIVRASLYFENLDEKLLIEHLEVVEDADFLRDKLYDLGLVAFVADGAILPRASGVDPRPMKKGQVVPFKSPDSLRVEVVLPNRGKIEGMGLRKGVNLIVGGGYHGKSTLLRALELGVYNHIPGDGREFVVTNPMTMKIRAEDGRRIEKVDISAFISNLPMGLDTKAFSTEDASGSTSQAANIIEALEVGARVLLIDEDTSATNFMIRDQRMQELVKKDNEPITPFIDKVQQLYEDLGVSTILAIGGSGDYFDVADFVICMMEYKPFDLTLEAKDIAKKYKTGRSPEGGKSFGRIIERIPLAESFDPSKGRRDVKISSKGLQSIIFGTHKIDLGYVEQLVSVSQTRAIGAAIFLATKYMDEKKTLREIVEMVLEDIKKDGLDRLDSRPVGDLAEFRVLELASAINRLRTLLMRKDG